MIITKLNFLHKSASLFSRSTYSVPTLAPWAEGSSEVQVIFMCFLWGPAPCRGQGKVILGFLLQGAVHLRKQAWGGGKERQAVALELGGFSPAFYWVSP